jgi:hypothetical protein
MISRTIGAVVLSLHKSIVILSESASSLAKKQRVEGSHLMPLPLSSRAPHDDDPHSRGEYNSRICFVLDGTSML